MARGQWAPVGLNMAFRAPLVPAGDPSWGEPLDAEPTEERIGRGGQRSWGCSDLVTGDRAVVVAGDQALSDARGLAEAAGWPLLAEPSSGHRAGPNALSTYRLLLDDLGGEIERVVVSGRPTLSRPVTRLLARRDLEVVRLRDDPRTPGVTGTPDPAWLRR